MDIDQRPDANATHRKVTSEIEIDSESDLSSPIDGDEDGDEKMAITERVYLQTD
jgi:hypothetical protein